MYVCSVMIMESYQKFQNLSIIIRPDEFTTLVSDVPFPAITLCPDLKTNLTEYNWHNKSLYMSQNPLSDIEYIFYLNNNIDLYD